MTSCGAGFLLTGTCSQTANAAADTATVCAPCNVAYALNYSSGCVPSVCDYPYELRGGQCTIPSPPPSPPSPPTPPPSPPAPPPPPKPAVATNTSCANQVTAQWIGLDQPVFNGALRDVLNVNSALLVNAAYSTSTGGVALNGSGYAVTQSPVAFSLATSFTLFLRFKPTRVGVAQVFYTANEPPGAYYFTVGVGANDRPFVQYATPSHENAQTYTSDATVSLNVDTVLQLQCGPGARRAGPCGSHVPLPPG